VRTSSSAAGELCLAREQRVGGEVLEVEALAALRSGLAARECEQRLDHLLEVLLGYEHALVRCAQRGETGLRVGERDLDQRSLARERRA